MTAPDTTPYYLSIVSDEKMLALYAYVFVLEKLESLFTTMQQQEV